MFISHLSYLKRRGVKTLLSLQTCITNMLTISGTIEKLFSCQKFKNNKKNYFTSYMFRDKLFLEKVHFTPYQVHKPVY